MILLLHQGVALYETSINSDSQEKIWLENFCRLVWTDNSNYICKKQSKTTGHHLKSREPRGQKWNILSFREREDYPLILSTDYNYDTLRQCRCHTHIIQESHHFSNVQTTPLSHAQIHTLPLSPQEPHDQRFVCTRRPEIDPPPRPIFLLILRTK